MQFCEKKSTSISDIMHGNRNTLTVFENQRKSLVQHCERSELRLHIDNTKVNKNAQNGQLWPVFENLKLAVKQCYQTDPF